MDTQQLLRKLRTDALRIVHKYHQASRQKRAIADGWPNGLTCAPCNATSLASVSKHLETEPHRPREGNRVCMCGISRRYATRVHEIEFWLHVAACRRSGPTPNALLMLSRRCMTACGVSVTSPTTPLTPSDGAPCKEPRRSTQVRLSSYLTVPRSDSRHQRAVCGRDVLALASPRPSLVAAKDFGWISRIGPPPTSGPSDDLNAVNTLTYDCTYDEVTAEPIEFSTNVSACLLGQLLESLPDSAAQDSIPSSASSTVDATDSANAAPTAPLIFGAVIFDGTVVGGGVGVVRGDSDRDRSRENGSNDRVRDDIGSDGDQLDVKDEGVNNEENGLGSEPIDIFAAAAPLFPHLAPTPFEPPTTTTKRRLETCQDDDDPINYRNDAEPEAKRARLAIASAVVDAIAPPDRAPAVTKTLPASVMLVKRSNASFLYHLVATARRLGLDGFHCAACCDLRNPDSDAGDLAGGEEVVCTADGIDSSNNSRRSRCCRVDEGGNRCRLVPIKQFFAHGRMHAPRSLRTPAPTNSAAAVFTSSSHGYCPSCDRYFMHSANESLRAAYATHMVFCALSNAETTGQPKLDRGRRVDPLARLRDKLRLVCDRFEMLYSPGLQRGYEMHLSTPRRTTPAARIESLSMTFALNRVLLDHVVPYLEQYERSTTTTSELKETVDDARASADPTDRNDAPRRLVDRGSLTRSYRSVVRSLLADLTSDERQPENKLLLTDENEYRDRAWEEERERDQLLYTPKSDRERIDLLDNSDGSSGPQFCCVQEVAGLRLRGLAEERTMVDESVTNTFGRIADFVDRTMPCWLQRMLAYRLPDYYRQPTSSSTGMGLGQHAAAETAKKLLPIDENRCGMSADVIALSALIQEDEDCSTKASRVKAGRVKVKTDSKDGATKATRSDRPPVFCHIFYYRSDAARVRRLLDDEKTCYVLPHTCLCADARASVTTSERFRKLHRHVIVVFRSAHHRRSYQAVVARGRRQPQPPGEPAHDPELRQYCKEIRTRAHYFNVVRYVSREKTLDTEQALVEMDEIRGAVDPYELPADVEPPPALYTVISDRLQLVNTKFAGFASQLRRQSEADAVLFHDDTRLGDVGDPAIKRTGDGPGDGDDDPDAELLSHAALSYHFACSRPVCSFALSLNSVLSPRGLDSLLSFRRLTLPLYRALVLHAYDRVNPRTSRASLCVRLGSVSKAAALPLFTHSLPYANPDDRESILRTHRFLRDVGARIPAAPPYASTPRSDASPPPDDRALRFDPTDENLDRPLEELRVSLFRDYMDEPIELDLKIASEVHRTRRLLGDLPRHVKSTLAQIHRGRMNARRAVSLLPIIHDSVVGLTDERDGLLRALDERNRALVNLTAERDRQLAEAHEEIRRLRAERELYPIRRPPSTDRLTCLTGVLPIAPRATPVTRDVWKVGEEEQKEDDDGDDDYHCQIHHTLADL